jgi:hypothetical protein
MAEYTDPDLRQRLKDEIQAGDRGGRPGQWSARKSQLLVQEYEKAGGGYVGERDERQKHLQQWGEEDWQHHDGTERYLPEAAWALLTPKEREATDARKRDADGQFAPNTDAAKAAHKVMHLPELKADEAVKLVRSLETKLELDKARKAELGGKGRKTVLDAIAARRDAL